MTSRTEFLRTITRRRLLERRPPRRLPPGAVGDATLRWGEPSNFQLSSGGGSPPPEQPESDLPPIGDEQDNVLEFTEVSRETTTVRISNPADPADFVDVERIDRISFKGPDGLIRAFILNN